MKQLPGLDASFLHLETAQMPMHVGALHNFELPAGYHGDFLADMRRHMAARLALAPALRQRLVKMPLNSSNPVWVDAEPDLAVHIVGITLPPGSGQAELERQVGLLHPVLLDRSRPLWKFHVFDGLADGPAGTRRFAMYTQLHHAAVDGQAAVALGQAILDLSPAGREVQAPASPRVRRELGMVGMLRAALGNQFGLVVSAVKAIPGTVEVLSQIASQQLGGGSNGAISAVLSRLQGQGAAAGGLALAPRTRLNVTVSERRAFATISLPLAQVNAARRRHQASLNDAVLMVCSGALRRHFLKHGPLPRKSMVAGVPISTRAKGDTASNNQATMTVVSLGTHIADPAKRLAHVLAATAAMKASIGALKSLMPSDFPTFGVPWLMQGLSALYAKARVAERLPAMANVTISNVPGPTVPLYMAGARMLTNYPASIVVHGVALNITVQTYDQSLEFGLIACGDAMPEVAELAREIQTAFDEFAALPASVVAAPVALPARKPAAGKGRGVAAKGGSKGAVKKAAAQPAAVKKTAAGKPAGNRPVAKMSAGTTATARPAALRPVTQATPRARASATTKKRPAR
ncbi:MAG: wax ester/triacylglycerol synthase family O-acyltransferase [Burkholderiales bacterium]|nr:wax ester/triacylglycerol synthase family O-acyltransferase [Burkholderiales bacterium]MDE2300052.1 wax ester/triacylglycerol synthase family O-acyltransferase [Burkholderiales bacterium]